MRILCLDVGSRRIGAAVSDELGLTAQSVETIDASNRRKALRRIGELCTRYRTTRVLVGLPLNMDGSEGPQAEKTRAFAHLLEAEGLEVRFQDERMTTMLATSALIEGGVSRKDRKQFVDQLAAAHILETFLARGGWQDPVPKKRLILGGIYHMKPNDENLLENAAIGEEEDLPENIVELTGEDGETVRFEHVMTLEHEGRTYLLLTPVEPMEDYEEDELVVLRIDEDESGEDCYVTLDDEDELENVYNQYLAIVEDEEDGEDA